VPQSRRDPDRRRAPLARAQATAAVTWTLSALATVCALTWSTSAFAQADPAAAIGLSRPHTGWISIHVSGRAGASAAIAEQGPAGPEPLTAVALPASGSADLDHAAAWRCDRTLRTFTLTVTGPDGSQQTSSAQLQTPSCRNRLAVALRPTHPRARRPATVQVIDRWAIGAIAARVCTARPAGVTRRCRGLRLAAGQSRAAFRFHPGRAGRYPVTVQGPAGFVAHRVLIVRPVSRRVRVLATGDSMIQIIDGDLQRRLGAHGPIKVRSDAHISTGISKPFMFNWVKHARASARTVHPDVTVMFLGANDGFPMGTTSGAKAPCCNKAWVTEYARRAKAMMRSYARGGSGTVYWLLLPTPRSKRFADVFGPVNRALRAAARSFPGVVHLVDLGATFTPGGRFRQTMRWEGHTVTVRQSDGVHLSVAGASIATTLIIRRMRRDGLVT
jgi:lysophospholipase L1-like esterase